MIPGLGRSPGGGKGYPLQYSGLENSMDYIVHGVPKSWTRLSDFHSHFKVKFIEEKKDRKREGGERENGSLSCGSYLYPGMNCDWTTSK